MSHYVPTKLVLTLTAPLICAFPECTTPVPPLPAPPPFSLLKATSAKLIPTKGDVRIFFCSEEHRDKYWQSEQGWFDRRVAMPSERALTGPAAAAGVTRMPYGHGRGGFDHAMIPAHGMGQGYGGCMASPMGIPGGIMPLTSHPTTPAPQNGPMSIPVHAQTRNPWTPPFIPRPGW